MTKNELQEYLKNHYERQHARQVMITTLTDYLEEWKTRDYFPGLNDHHKFFHEAIDRERATMVKEAATVHAWSDLIKNDTYRAIFCDRYIYGLKWDDIEEKYHYSRSQIYEINRRCCQEIARKTVTDIVTAPQSHAVSI